MKYFKPDPIQPYAPPPPRPEIINPYVNAPCREESSRFITCIQSSWPNTIARDQKVTNCEQCLRDFIHCLGPTI